MPDLLPTRLGLPTSWTYSLEPAHRRRGLAGAMIRFAMDHPEHRDVYQWLLATQDAHPVYEKLGFKPLEHPERWMIFRQQRSQ